MDMLMTFLGWFGFLCHPRARFTATEMRILNMVYDDAPVPALAFATFRHDTTSETHINELLLVMQGHPEWKVDQMARDILNGTHQWRRWLGYGMFKLLTTGSSCTCCAGWRAILFSLVSFGLGYAFHFGLSKVT